MAELSSSDMFVPLALGQRYWPTLSAGDWQDRKARIVQDYWRRKKPAHLVCVRDDSKTLSKYTHSNQEMFLTIGMNHSHAVTSKVALFRFQLPSIIETIELHRV